METEVRPSHLPQDPHWLAIEAWGRVDQKNIMVRKEKYFVSDLDKIQPDLKVQNEDFTFRSVGLNEEMIKMLKSHGDVERVWATSIMKNGKPAERVLSFKYSLVKVRFADMLKDKNA